MRRSDKHRLIALLKTLRPAPPIPPEVLKKIKEKLMKPTNCGSQASARGDALENGEKRYKEAIVD